MNQPTKTIERAKMEVKALLKRYRVSWDDIAPDRDKEIWESVRPLAKRVRKTLFRKTYSSAK